MTAQGLAAALRAARIAHSIEVIQGGVGQCLECGELLRVEYGDDGQPLFNPFIEHHLKVQADAALAWLETVAGDAAVRADVAEELRNVGHCPPSKYAEVAFMDANHAADAALAAVLAALGQEGACEHEWFVEPRRVCERDGTEVCARCGERRPVDDEGRSGAQEEGK